MIDIPAHLSKHLTLTGDRKYEFFGAAFDYNDGGRLAEFTPEAIKVLEQNLRLVGGDERKVIWYEFFGIDVNQHQVLKYLGNMTDDRAGILRAYVQPAKGKPDQCRAAVMFLGKRIPTDEILGKISRMSQHQIDTILQCSLTARDPKKAAAEEFRKIFAEIDRAVAAAAAFMIYGGHTFGRKTM